MKPASIRYPGGCFASTYRWKDAVGPREKRKYCPASLWADRDSNQFGSDEFLLLCRKVGAEPVLVVNATRGIQETLDWIEYCNGEQGTTWGKRRANNGHPGPYRVKFWEIDNEAWPHMTAEAYAKIVTTFSQAIRRQGPRACESSPAAAPTTTTANRPKARAIPTAGTSAFLQRAARDFDYLSLHYYNGEYIRRDHVEDPRAFEAYLQEEVGRLIRASANPAIQVYCSEWAMIDNDWPLRVVRRGDPQRLRANGPTDDDKLPGRLAPDVSTPLAQQRGPLRSSHLVPGPDLRRGEAVARPLCAEAGETCRAGASLERSRHGQRGRQGPLLQGRQSAQ